MIVRLDAKVAIAALLASLALPHVGGAQTESRSWFCPMHLEVIEGAPGSCPICRMSLVPGDPHLAREYRLELTTEPAAIRAAVPTELRLRVKDPQTGAIVRDFEVVHAKRYHLFVVAQDFEFFDHVHPDQQKDGSLDALDHVAQARLLTSVLGLPRP